LLMAAIKFVRSRETSKLPAEDVTARFAGRLPSFIAKVAEYKPEIIVAPGSSGRIVAYFLRKHLGIKKVFFLSRAFKRRGRELTEMLPGGNPLLEKAANGKRVLVVDDFAISGASGAKVADYLRRMSPASVGFMSMTHYRHGREEALSLLSKKYRDVDLGEGMENWNDSLRGHSPGPMVKNSKGEVEILRTDNYRIFLKKVEALLEESRGKK